MPLKFRLKGLAETFIDALVCPECGHDGGESGDNDFSTELTRVTLDGIVVVVQCQRCGNIFVPSDQRLGILNLGRLRKAVEKDSLQNGEPVIPNKEAVHLNVEKLNAARKNDIH